MDGRTIPRRAALLGSRVVIEDYAVVRVTRAVAVQNASAKRALRGMLRGSEVGAGGRLRVVDSNDGNRRTPPHRTPAGREEPGLDGLSSNRAEGLRVNRCASCLAAHEHE